MSERAQGLTGHGLLLDDKDDGFSCRKRRGKLTEEERLAKAAEKEAAKQARLDARCPSCVSSDLVLEKRLLVRQNRQ